MKPYVLDFSMSFLCEIVIILTQGVSVDAEALHLLDQRGPVDA